MYYDGQADRSDSDWLDGLQEPMRLDSQIQGKSLISGLGGA